MRKRGREFNNVEEMKICQFHFVNVYSLHACIVHLAQSGGIGKMLLNSVKINATYRIMPSVIYMLELTKIHIHLFFLFQFELHEM